MQVKLTDFLFTVDRMGYERPELQHYCKNIIIIVKIWSV